MVCGSQYFFANRAKPELRSGGTQSRAEHAEGYLPVCTEPEQSAGGGRSGIPRAEPKGTLDGVGAAGPAFRVRDMEGAKQSP
jgi:hypothetical protein